MAEAAAVHQTGTDETKTKRESEGGVKRDLKGSITRAQRGPYLGSTGPESELAGLDDDMKGERQGLTGPNGGQAGA